jgi:inosine-uridine nucleoside N-ribohydrolase
MQNSTQHWLTRSRQFTKRPLHNCTQHQNNKPASLPAASQEYQAEDGADLIIDLVKNSEEKITILVTGAEADMALAIQTDARFGQRLTDYALHFRCEL